MHDGLERFRCERLPVGDDASRGFTLRRTSHERPSNLVSISRDIFGIRTHWHGGRTCPCKRIECPACLDGKLSRWNGYLLAVDKRDQARIVFEFTPACATQFDNAFRELGTLRGVEFVASRTSNRPNGKVAVQVKGVHPKAAALPCDLAIWPILAHIWGIRLPLSLVDDVRLDVDQDNGPGPVGERKINLPGQGDSFAGEIAQLTSRSLGEGLNGHASPSGF